MAVVTVFVAKCIQFQGFFPPFVPLRLIFCGVLSYFSLLYHNVPAQMSVSTAAFLPPSPAPADWLFGGCAAAPCVGGCSLKQVLKHL